MSGLLLQTKLFKPTPRPSLITRPQLINRLNDGLGLGTEGFAARLTLVSAPAGFGKTSLITSWLAQLAASGAAPSGAQTAWLSLDEGDNDPVRFLTYLAAALQTAVPDTGEAAIRDLQSPEPPPAEAVLTLLINDVIRHGQPVILVLSDYHAISTPAVHQALAYLLDHLPPLLHLLITTRSDPPLHLSRLRAQGQMVELRTDDMRFTSDEIRQFFSQATGLALSNDEIAALERRTEGWITGLQLAALSLKGRDNQSELIAAFTGSHHFVIDYLTEEVLNHQPETVREFLLATSILKRLCGPLADALTNGSGGQETLEHLEHNNLFLTPLDQERHWYRYHHLFADVLQSRLRQSRPVYLAELHQHACAWFAREGLIDEAIGHALAGGDLEQAVSLIEGIAGRMIRQGASASLARWLDALPEELVRSHPRLCLARGWMFVWGSVLNPEAAGEWVQHALRAAGQSPAPDATLRGQIAALQAMGLSMEGGSAQSIELSLEALAYLPGDNPWRSVLNFALGTDYYAGGALAAATGALQEALQLSESNGVHYVQLIAGSLLADILAVKGHLGQASVLYHQVLAWADNGLPQKGVVLAHGGLAGIHYERGEQGAALAHLQSGAEQLARVGGLWPTLAVHLPEARLRQGQGDWPQALAALERASQSAQSAGDNRVVQQLAAQRACVQLAQGDLAAAGQWAASSELSPDEPEAGLPGLFGVEQLALARVLHVQGRHAEALALLDRLLESAQAEERQGNAITILALQALAYQSQGNDGDALGCLEWALALAEPEGYCRVFVDEGESMARLLRLALRQGIFPNYTTRLLGAFEGGMPGRIASGLLPEPLSEREMEVLRLAATGASNKEIAGALFIALPTVKKHIGHILVKLDTQNRVQAITRARELGLLV